MSKKLTLRQSPIRVRLAIGEANPCYKIVKDLKDEEIRVWAVSAMNIVATTMSAKAVSLTDFSQEQPSEIASLQENSGKPAAKERKKSEPAVPIAKTGGGMKIAGFTKDVKW